MHKIISIFNNKGGVGKTTITWNIADALGRAGKKVLLIDFDPQCNLSLAILGEEHFGRLVNQTQHSYGVTIKSYLQPDLQNLSGRTVFLHQNEREHSTSDNVHLIAGDFWLNSYADSINVGNDLLQGSRIANFSSIQRIVDEVSESESIEFDFVIVDLPPSFGILVRIALYCSDYFIVPCTSDSFSAYCVGLIGDMIPSFMNDLRSGLDRFRQSNPDIDAFDNLGKLKFAGWVFNGFDTKRPPRTQAQIQAGVQNPRRLVQADETMRQRLEEAIENNLVNEMRRRSSLELDPIAPNLGSNYQIGKIEDANVLMQNSLWLNVPLGQLNHHQQVRDLQNRRAWVSNQIEQIALLKSSFEATANEIIRVCI